MTEPGKAWKIGDRVVAPRGATASLPGRVADVEKQMIYNGPKTGPYQVKPVAVYTYVVAHDDGTVRRYKDPAMLTRETAT